MATGSSTYRDDYGDGSQKQTSTSVSFTDTFIVDKNKNVTTLTGNNQAITLTHNYSQFTAGCSLVLFTLNTNGSTSTKTTAKIYNCKIYDNGTLIRDYVPCYKKTNNSIGLYDLVNRVFYTNSGSGTFTKGADVN